MTETVKLEIETTNCGTLTVYAQGNIEDKSKPAILTVHDLGSNHRSFIDYANQPCNDEIRAKSIFLHVCLPGQEDNAPDWQKPTYPKLQQIAEDLVHILVATDIKTCIAFGEGVGANIVCRFGIAYPNKVLGVCMVHCTSTTAGVVEYIKDKMMQWRLSLGMNQQAYDFLLYHKFGANASKFSPSKRDRSLSMDIHQQPSLPLKDVQDTTTVVKHYLADLQMRMNSKNLSLLLNSFLKRTDISHTLAKDLKMDTLLVVGSKASNIQTVYHTHQLMNPAHSTLLVVDGVGDVMTELPERLTRAFILFAKGFGVMNTVNMPGMVMGQRMIAGSMEEADKPRKHSLGGAITE